MLYTFYDAKSLTWRKRVFSLFEVFEVNQVLQFTHRYEVDNSSRKNRLKNMKMNKNKKYDKDPRCLWNDREAWDTFPSFLVSIAIFVFSILSSSASCERSFSRMGLVVANRMAAITADNADKRLTLCNQLYRKRWLLELCRERKIKRTKLNEDLFK